MSVHLVEPLLNETQCATVPHRSSWPSWDALAGFFCRGQNISIFLGTTSSQKSHKNTSVLNIYISPFIIGGTQKAGQILKQPREPIPYDRS